MGTCRYCNQGDASVEVFGFAIHKLDDRWVSCAAKNPNAPFEQGIIAKRDEHLRPLPRSEVSTAQSRKLQKVLMQPDRLDSGDPGY
jgi:hypothetical protein